MVTTLNFKDTIDLPKWRDLAQPVNNSVNNFGLCSDLRNNEDRHPYVYSNITTTSMSAYDTKSDGWVSVIVNILLGSSYSSSVFMSAQGPRGTIAAGATTTSFTLTTALPAAVGVNSLANRGDGRGFKVRIIGNSAGGSGKTEERLIVANTSGTTPTIVVDSAFSFTPANGDAYEFLSGKVYILGTSNAANSFKSYDVLTNFLSAGLSVANLPAAWTSSNLIGLDELLVPYDRSPGEGFFGTLTATASAAATLTGQAAGGDAGVVANQYRNFQIRIVQDTATPTAVGQRRNITSHTAGASPVYTVPAWAVTPSATASYVIENNGDRIIAWMNGTTQTSTYTIAGNAWDANTTFAVRPVAPSDGLMSQQAFSIEPDSALNARQSHIFSFRGGGVATLDLFDISGAATGVWTSGITVGNTSIILSAQFVTGSSSTQDPAANQGRYMYMIAGGVLSNQRMFRFDMKNRIAESYSFLRLNMAASVSGTKSLAQTIFIDGTTKLSTILYSVNDSAGIQKLFGLSITR